MGKGLAVSVFHFYIVPTILITTLLADTRIPALYI